jgi:hypothetical protein
MIPKKKKVIPNGKKTNADLKQAAFRIYIDQVWNIIGRMPFDLESLNKEQSMARFKALDHFESNRIGNMKKWRNPQKELEKKIIVILWFLTNNDLFPACLSQASRAE